MERGRRHLRPNELAIISVLERSRIALNTREIARYTNMSWRTAKRVLGDLETYGIVQKRDKKNMILWWLVRR
jgi:DNA-binding IclR family transcriptional regulator